jgi:hypothetical protein
LLVLNLILLHYGHNAPKLVCVQQRYFLNHFVFVDQLVWLIVCIIQNLSSVLVCLTCLVYFVPYESADFVFLIIRHLMLPELLVNLVLDLISLVLIIVILEEAIVSVLN